ncbi:MAG: hypothetical protein ACJASQ_002054 [Crocinitomicaceae bacterium]|jgi:hypothetical protein
MKSFKVALAFFSILAVSCNTQNTDDDKGPLVESNEDVVAFLRANRNLMGAWKFDDSDANVRFEFEVYRGVPEPGADIQYTALFIDGSPKLQAVRRKGEFRFNVFLNDYFDYFIVDSIGQTSFFKEEVNLSENGFNIQRLD